MDSSRNRTLYWVLVALRVILGVIFVYAAWTKLRDPWQLFAMGIDSYKVVPLEVGNFIARTLPWFELLLGIVLIAGVWLRLSSVVTSLLLAVFFGLLVRAKVKGMDISCGCFGQGEVMSWKTLVRDGSMLAGSLFLTWQALRKPRKMA